MMGVHYLEEGRTMKAVVEEEEAEPVGRKRTDGEGGGQRKRPDADPRKIVLAVRGRQAWKDWIDRLAAHDRSSINELIDRALARYAREIGFKEVPPER
jgi:hypothetical protein